MSQRIHLDATPGLFHQVLHCHQGDVGRQFEIAVVTRDGYEIPSGATFKIQATKPSGLGFTVTGTAANNIISFTSTEDMTSEAGEIPTQLEIKSGNDVIYTSNFLLVCETNVHPSSVTDGSPEEIISEITLLVERAESAASTAGADAAAAAQARVDEMMNYLPTEVTNLKSDLGYITDCKPISIGNVGLYRLGDSSVDINNPTPNNYYKCVAIACNSGDVFTISGKSYGGSARLYGFTRSNGEIISTVPANYEADHLIITAPNNSSYLLVNEYLDDGYDVTVVQGLVVNEQMSRIVQSATSYRNVFNGFVQKSVNSGSQVVDNSLIWSVIWDGNDGKCYHISAVGEKNRFILYGVKNNNATELFRFSNDAVPYIATYVYENTTNYSSFILILNFTETETTFDIDCNVYEADSTLLPHFSVNGVEVATYFDPRLEKVLHYANLFDLNTSTLDYSLSSSTGELVALQGFNTSDYIEVEGNEQYRFTAKWTVAFYDENLQFISGIPSSQAYVSLITVPQGAKFLRFSYDSTWNFIMLTKGTDAIDYIPHELKVKDEYIPNLNRYALSFETIKKCGGFTESLNNLCLIAIKSIASNVTKYSGYLFADYVDNKFYYADPQLDEITFIFDWDSTLTQVNPQNYLATITADGDVIFLRKWVRDNPIIYPHGDYSHPYIVDFGSDTAPYGFLVSASIVQFDDGSFVFGDYCPHSLESEQANDPRNIWRVTKPYSNKNNWSVAHRFKHVYYESPVSDEPDNEIGHIHTMVWDFYANELYCSTGDIDRHCRVWKSTDYGVTWNEVASGGQKYRAVGMCFTENGAYWGTDSFFENHNLWNVKRDTNGILDFNTLNLVCSLEPYTRDGTQSQATYGTIRLRTPNGLLFMDRAEPRTDDKLEIPFYSFDDNKLYMVHTFGKSSYIFETETRNGLPNQCYTEYQPDTLDCVLTGGGSIIRPNCTDVFGNMPNNYIGVLKMRVVSESNYVNRPLNQ